MKFKNLYLALQSQLPWKRFFVNFFVTRNAWGLFSKRSHTNENGIPKIAFSEKSANRAALDMEKKRGIHFSVYKCIYCDGWHIGKNRTSIANAEKTN